MDPAILRAQLQQPYRRDSWRAILPQLLPSVQFFAQPAEFQLTSERERQVATARRQLGVATVAGETGVSKKIAIYEIDVAANVDLPRNRVSLRELIARCIDQVNAHAVLAFFIQSGCDEYRLTYAARGSELDLETLEVQTRETAPKRFTFLLGPAEPCRTAAQRLAELAEKKDEVTLRDVECAFSVERLNKEFFATYKHHYQVFVEYLINDTDAPEKIFGVTAARDDEEEFERACKPLRDFVKRLLGRIVFLHFLQRKGWLGSKPNSKEWENGDRDFILHYFEKAEQSGEAAQFHSGRLTPLFFDVLNNPDRPRDLFAPTGTRIPYLNGGLFEDTLADACQIDFPAVFFRELLDFFSQYNFTIDENDPEENEVGIDPEMLGHIFENLLEDNKDKGAYYTPKAIVQYMCQQALLQYLRAHVGEHPELDRLVIEKDTGDRNVRSWVRQHAQQIEQLIDNVKICDPAVGSGAFPIGMLNEMLQIKLALDFTLNPHEAKKALVENSLHGVDIDPGAIEIARLRFWLSLVVDAKTPEPLPNLDYKVYCADSLVERVRGEAVNVGTKTPDDPQLRTAIENLVAAKHKLYEAHSKPQKREARHALYAALGSLAQIELTHLRNQAHFTDEEFGRVVDSIEELGKLLRDLDAMKKAKVADRERALDAIQHWFEDPNKPTFLWQLHFAEIFADGGFHIVIENPPYVRQESIRHIKPRLKKVFTCYTGMADLFVYFYERSIELLRERGTLSIITSNKYHRSAYGEKLRGYLTKHLTLHTLIDFGDAPVFSSIAYASILVATNQTAAANHDLRVHNWERGDQLPLIIQIIQLKGFDLPQSKLTADGWRLEQQEVHALLEKLRSKGVPLGKLVNGHFSRGILTGLNEAFVMDEATKNRLIAEDPKSIEVIKPFLRGRDVKRWRAEHQGCY
jgi:type I restriction-modification system DNA methylase subunit